jgi:hypothetical protein
MFAGHIGVALAIGRADRRLNVGAFVSAALLLDIALWLFVLLGWESVTIPANFSRTQQPEFIFPYSHGLLAAAVWSALAGAAVFIRYPRLKERKLRAAALVGMAAFSHWLLDALVHVPQLPLAAASSGKVGLGLWQHMPLALAAEGVILVAGLLLFLRGADLSRTRQFWLAVLALLVLVFTVVGMTVSPPPSSARAMAASSLVTIIVVCALACWLGRLPNMDRGLSVNKV